MAAIYVFYNSCCHDLNLLNKANIILLPKKEGADKDGKGHAASGY
jgi:hypothetical protein